MSETVKKPTWGKVGLLIVIYLVVELIAKVVMSLTLPMGPSKLSLDPSVAQMSAGEMVLLGVIIAPILEELIFRGILFNGLRYGVGWVVKRFTAAPQAITTVQYLAIALSAIAFGLVHEEAYFGNFAMHAMFGAMAAHLYLKTGRLVAPLALHMLNNAIPALVALALGSTFA